MRCPKCQAPMKYESCAKWERYRCTNTECKHLIYPHKKSANQRTLFSQTK